MLLFTIRLQHSCTTESVFSKLGSGASAVLTASTPSKPTANYLSMEEVCVILLQANQQGTILILKLH